MPPRKRNEPASIPYQLCTTGSGCKTPMLAVRELDTLQKGKFEYTTPSALPGHSAEDRRTHGCTEGWKTVKKGPNKGKKYWDFTGKYCRKWENPKETDPRKKRCKAGQDVPDPYCSAKSDPCSPSRLGCPVQLIFLRGKPHLRFCRAEKERGYVVPASSPEKAQKIAAEACKKWRRLERIEVGVDEKGKPVTRVEPLPANFFERNAPQIVTQARRALPATGGLAQPPPSLPILLLPALIVAPLFLVAWSRR